VDAAFYFDLASPVAYIAAERVLHVVPGPLEWQPILARELPGAESFEAFRCETEEQIFRAEIERRARGVGLQPLRWPEPFPFDSALAMRAATYAKSIGRVVPFAQAAFRQAFAGGHNLERPDFVLIAAAACEMHPQAVMRGAELRSVRGQLAQATSEAAKMGVGDVPAVRIGEHVFSGERALDEAAGYLGKADGREHLARGTRATAPPAAPTASAAPTPDAQARDTNTISVSDSTTAGAQ
jgi:2-hydroxychromene-2-carboxylate isomerase